MRRCIRVILKRGVRSVELKEYAVSSLGGALHFSDIRCVVDKGLVKGTTLIDDRPKEHLNMEDMNSSRSFTPTWLDPTSPTAIRLLST